MKSESTKLVCGDCGESDLHDPSCVYKGSVQREQTVFSELAESSPQSEEVELNYCPSCHMYSVLPNHCDNCGGNLVHQESEEIEGVKLLPCPKCRDCWALKTAIHQNECRVICGRCGFSAPLAAWNTRAVNSSAEPDPDKAMCPHEPCSRIWTNEMLRDDKRIPTHDFPEPCRAVCPGSGQWPASVPLVNSSATQNQDQESVKGSPLRAALERIERWFGEFPETGRTRDDGSPMSYACFGTNGERDYIRGIARDALNVNPITQGTASASALAQDVPDESSLPHPLAIFDAGFGHLPESESSSATQKVDVEKLAREAAEKIADNLFGNADRLRPTQNGIQRTSSLSPQYVIAETTSIIASVFASSATQTESCENGEAPTVGLSANPERDWSIGDIIAAYPDGTIVLDDGLTTWNDIRAKPFLDKIKADEAAFDLMDEVQHRMDAVVDAAVAWCESGEEGESVADSFEKGETLSNAVYRLKQLRSKPAAIALADKQEAK